VVSTLDLLGAVLFSVVAEVNVGSLGGVRVGLPGLSCFPPYLSARTYVVQVESAWDSLNCVALCVTD
jgi:hypothetical protein